MIMKRALSFVLAIIMVLGLVPTVSAAETELTVNGLTPTYGQAQLVDWYTGELTDKLTDGTVSWLSNGNTIQAWAVPSKTNLAGAKLTLTNASGADATLKFDYSLTGGTVRFENDLVVSDPYDEGKTVTGSYTFELTAGQSINIEIVSAGYDSDYDEWFEQEASLTIANISLATGGDQTVTFQPVEGGSYTVNGAALDTEKACTAPSGTEYTLAATAAEGYQFFGWYNETTSSYVSYDATTKLSATGNWTIYPVFLSADKAIFAVGSVKFDDLSKANAFANGGTIVLVNDGILPEGNYTVSAGNTLLIPYDNANSVHTEATSTATVNDSGNIWTNKEWETPKAYRTLTMAAGAKLTIQGSLNVGGKHSAGPFLTAGSPSGDLGMIQMAEGSNITVADGGVLYCWGYIYGKGTVTVKSGAKVHENIQFADFRGGNATAGIAMSFLVFPMTQYYVQNIEVATTYEYGAIEEVWGSIFIGSNNQAYGTSVKFIGPDPNTAMFVPGEGGSVTKTYVPGSDRLQMDVNGGGSINPMTLDMEAITSVLGAPLNTATFVLPITNNMTINVNSGTTTLNQSLGLLPGVELNIARDAVLYVNAGDVLLDDEGNPALYSSGHNLIVYDRDQWLSGWIQGEDGIEPVETYYVYNGKRLQPVAWSPTCSYTRTEADLVDAVLDINGSLITDGFVYTTVNIEPDENPENELGIKFVGSTPIISSGKTGKIVMNNGAGVDMMTMQATQNGTDPIFVTLFMVSARLQNADGSYLDTMGAEPGATFSYCDKCGQWYAGNEDTHTVEITWIVDGVGEPQEICKGTKPVYGIGTDPVKDGFEFLGWSLTAGGQVLETLPLATEDAVYYAIFEEKAEGLLGDMNLDGKVDAADLTMLARHIGGIEYITNSQALENADVNGDGQVEAKDLTKQARYVGGIINDWDQE